MKVLKFLMLNKYEIYSFLPFEYDNDEGISIVFWNSKADKLNGDILIDVGFTKLFNELKGTYRYVQILLLGPQNFKEELENVEIIWYMFLKFHHLFKKSIIKKFGLDLNQKDIIMNLISLIW